MHGNMNVKKKNFWY